MKEKKIYVCSSCGNEYLQSYGKCPQCGEWGTIAEKLVSPSPSYQGGTRYGHRTGYRAPQLVPHITYHKEQRIDTCNDELNRVLGGGLVVGSFTLIGGEPGIGKSTLVLQTALKMKGKRVLYASGEESEGQLKMRAERLGDMESECFILSEIYIDEVFMAAEELHADLVIVDSIQTFKGDETQTPGSPSQVRDCADRIQQFTRRSNIPVIVIGHITKDGAIAGPKILEHIVDTVLQFEGDHQHMYRLLRANKNRFGSTNEIAIFEMQHNGLREVSNPSELLLTTHTDEMSGIAIGAMVEGVRPFLVEVQALVSTAAYGMPQRSATGFDTRRMNMLLAVLEKRVGFKLAQKDVFLNIAGGLRVNDPALDLSVVSAILSSNLDIAINYTTALTGEVGLSGEIRPVARLDQRIAEAEKLGFQRIVIPQLSNDVKTTNRDIEVIKATKIEDVFRLLFS